MTKALAPNARVMLFVIAFAESCFFPVPPDVMLVPMCLADRKRAFWLAAWCTLTSVIGGILGYVIGAFLYESVGQWLISLYGHSDDVETFRALYAEYGAWIIVAKGMTPIPYKIVTILSGFSGYDFLMFMLLSAVTRGARFGIESALLYRFGEPVRGFIEKRLEWAMLAVFTVVVLGFAIARYII